jgi:hypothetical protein
MSVARDSLGANLGLEEFSARFFKDGQAGTSFIELPPSLNDLQKREAFIKDYRNAYAGSQNAHKTAFLPQGTRVTHAGADGDSTQMVQSKEMGLIEVANLLGCSAHKLGHQLSSSYASLEQESLDFLADSLDMLLVEWEQECAKKLLTEFEKRTGRREIKADRRALITIDAETQTKLVIDQTNNGLVSEEYARALLNLPEKDEDETYRRPSNVVVEGEEPPAPPPIQLPLEPQPVTQDGEDDSKEDTARQLTKQIFKRLLTRLEKSVEGGKRDLSAHREVMVDHLSIYPTAEVVIADLLARLQPEVDEILPEQAHYVFSRIDTDKECEALWTK